MGSEELPNELEEFLNKHIDSVEQLSILLLLQKNPEKIWTTAEINRELRSADSSIAKRLEDLYTRKILTRFSDDGSLHKFNPNSAELSATINLLAEQNSLRPYRIIEAIYSPLNKGAQAFADAFKLRREKP